MSLRFDHSQKWRALAISGTAEIGAVFLAVKGKWTWRIWDAGRTREGTAKTELAAKNALQAAWADWLRSVNLKEKEIE